MAKPKAKNPERLIAEAHSSANLAIHQAAKKVSELAEAISCEAQRLYPAFPEAKAAALNWLADSLNMAEMQAAAIKELMADIKRPRPEAGLAVANLQEVVS